MKKLFSKAATGLCALVLSGCTALPHQSEGPVLNVPAISLPDEGVTISHKQDCEASACPAAPNTTNHSCNEDYDTFSFPRLTQLGENLHLGESVDVAYANALIRPYGLAREEKNSLITIAEARLDADPLFAKAWARNSYNLTDDRNYEIDFGVESGVTIHSPECLPALGCTSIFGGAQRWTLTDCNNHTTFVYGGVENTNCFTNSRFLVGTNADLGGTLFTGTVNAKRPLLEGRFGTLKVGPYVDFALADSAGFNDGDGFDVKQGMIYVTPGLEASFERNHNSLFLRAGYQFGEQPKFYHETITPSTTVISAGATLRF